MCKFYGVGFISSLNSFLEFVLFSQDNQFQQIKRWKKQISIFHKNLKNHHFRRNFSEKAAIWAKILYSWKFLMFENTLFSAK